MIEGVVLAAGRGTRLRPITDELPKVLVPINSEALIDRSIVQLSDAGVSRFIIVVGYKGKLVERHVRRAFPQLQFSFVEQVELNGTAGALRAAAPYISNDFALVFGDTWFADGALTKAVRVESNAAVFSIWSERPENYGCLRINDDGLLVEILEKPKRPPSNQVVLGGYKLPFNTLRYLDLLSKSVRGEVELPDLIGIAIESGVRFVPVDMGQTCDIATMEDIVALEEVLRNF